MRGFLSTAIKTALLAGFSIASVTMISNPAQASEHHHRYHYHHHTETIHFPTFDPGSEGNSPSICDGQVGYWTQIPMPGGKTFCVLHFTEFFKGGVGSGSDQVCVTTKSWGYGAWKHTRVVGTSPGACKSKPWGDGGMTK